MTFVGVLVLIIGIILAIALHEIGHLVPAKLFGVKVPQYFVGFGPTLWSTTKNGTEYGIKAIPLGGFVRLAGMYAPAKEGTPLTNRKGQLTLAEEARRASAEDIEPGEEHRAFYNLSTPKKIIVMLGGPLVNLLIAFTLAIILMVGIGAPTLTNGVGAVSDCVEPCTNGQEAPGRAGGLREGDEILSWGGMETHDWSDVQSAIASSDAGPTQVVIERDGQQQTLTITPVMAERPVVDDNGYALEEHGQPVTTMMPFVGIGPAVGLERQSVSAVPSYIGNMVWQTAGILVRLPVKLYDLTADMIAGRERDPQSLVGMVGVAQVAGQITGTDVAGYTGVEKTADLLNLLIALNVSLFAFNMLPLVPLDGGHIAGGLVEGLRRWVAKLRGKPDPGPLDTARLVPISYIVAACFIVMTVLLVVADIVNPISL